MRISKIGWIFVFVLISVRGYTFPERPEPQQTPGELCALNDSDYEERRYPEKIIYCKRNVSDGKKNRVYEAYGIPKKCRGRYTIDHFVPLSIGGNNSDENLWPEHKLIKADRPDLEQEVFDALRRGEIKQKEAIQIVIREKMNYHRQLRGQFARGACDTN